MDNRIILMLLALIRDVACCPDSLVVNVPVSSVIVGCILLLVSLRRLKWYKSPYTKSTLVLLLQQLTKGDLTTEQHDTMLAWHNTSCNWRRPDSYQLMQHQVTHAAAKLWVSSQ